MKVCKECGRVPVVETVVGGQIHPKYKRIACSCGRKTSCCKDDFGAYKNGQDAFAVLSEEWNVMN